MIPLGPPSRLSGPSFTSRGREPAKGKTAADLQPGDNLVIGGGTYSVERMWDLRVSGTAEVPVWIVAAKDARVIITRPDARQNVLNIGQGGPVGFLALRLEITGGSHGVRIGQCSDLWLDSCQGNFRFPSFTCNARWQGHV